MYIEPRTAQRAIDPSDGAGLIGAYNPVAPPPLDAPTANGLLASALGDLDGRLRELSEKLDHLALHLGPVLNQGPAEANTKPGLPPSSCPIISCVGELSVRVMLQIELVRDLQRRLVV